MRYRAFIRVSDERQDQATQELAIGTHVSSKGYDLAGEPHCMKGSAYHNRQVKLLQQAIDEMLSGAYDVLVCSASSRLWRGRSAARAVVMMDEAEERGARFDFVGEPHISTGGTPADYMEMIRLQAFQVNRRESDMKSERSKNTHAMHRATGVVSGREPWGTVIACDVCGHITTRQHDGSVNRCGHKHAKHYVPTDEARLLVPQIIARAIKGESTMTMAPWLSEETGTPWHETLVGRIIRRGDFYADLGLVSPSDAQAARAAYEGRSRGGKKAGPNHEPALLIPACPCGSKMYRCFGGKEGLRDAWYRCRAKCGRKMLRCSDLDEAVIEAMTADLAPHMERVWVAGADAADRAAKLRAEAAKAYMAGDKARFNKLDSEADALDAEPKVRPHWSRRMSCGCETLTPEHAGHEWQTEADYFASLSPGQRREYFSQLIVTACLDATERIPVVSINPR